MCHNLRRRCEHEPAHAPEPLETISAAACPESLPSEQTISREEEAILWRALERIPVIYREPLILFYREHQSVEQVAQGLELSTDAVKQRLARGRKMLQENIAGFVEGALQRTGPGKTFTVGVLAALPVFAAGSAMGATIGAAGVAVKASTAAKTAAAAGLSGALIGPLLGVLGGAVGAWMSIRNTASARERQFMIRQTWISAGFCLVFLVALFAVTFLGRPLAHAHPMAFGCALAFWFIGFWTLMLIWIVRSNRRQKQIRIEDGTENTLLPPLIPMRLQQFFMVYGSLGGGTVGVLPGWWPRRCRFNNRLRQRSRFCLARRWCSLARGPGL